MQDYVDIGWGGWCLNDVTLQELNDIVFWAFRYTLGRMSYSVFDVTEFIKRHAELLFPHTKSSMVYEIKKAFDRGELGMECDVQEWLEVVVILEA